MTGHALKKALIACAILLVTAGAAVFIYRYQLLQYTSEKLIRSALPEYIKIGSIGFDLAQGKVTLKGFRIESSPGFSYKNIVEIEEVICRYKLKGRGGLLLHGLEILEPSIVKPAIYIERLADGRVNLTETGRMISRPSEGQDKPAPAATGRAGAASPGLPEAKSAKISDIFKLPESFVVKDGLVVYKDSMVSPDKPHLLNFDHIKGNISLRLDSDYSKVMRVGSTGQGMLNNDSSQPVKWDISYDPNTPRLTMSNRFEVSGIDVTLFAPYYDKYSPFVFHKGKMSGTLIFDFDNGNIGSTNEIRLKDLAISVKQGFENSRSWFTTVQDLAKYFTQFGEIVFDFKIKGDMNDPKFMLGPISKQALTMMAIDKISQIVAETASGSKEEKPQTEKAMEYIDLIQNLMKKSK